MQFTKAIALFSLVTTGFSAALPAAAPQAEGEIAAPKPVINTGEEAVTLNKRGYGCPNDYSCSNYCDSINRNGGHCGGFLWQVCYCNQS
ncbi:hypothetical protein FE257_000358 [Aspergillus nanangensis]|uniref:Invertebrate defensins family profile domain-containing protein n=1 Tax=Aspergillus nanangensis TaxID=2582783 RepID=A0AAD4GWH1_ASPNN|nr:hypothetical protein FE257_000358 [Aspergillus nanangensis]